MSICKYLPVVILLLISPLISGFYAAESFATEPERHAAKDIIGQVISQVQEANRNWLMERQLHFLYHCTYKVDIYERSGAVLVSYEVKEPFTRGISFDPNLEMLIYSRETPYNIIKSDKYYALCYDLPLYVIYRLKPTTMSLWHWNIDMRPSKNDVSHTYVYVDTESYRIKHVLMLSDAESIDDESTFENHFGAYFYDYIYEDSNKLTRIDIYYIKEPDNFIHDARSATFLNVDDIREKHDPQVRYNVSWAKDIAYFDSLYTNIGTKPVLQVRISDFKVGPLPYSRNESDFMWLHHAYDRDIPL